MKTDKLRTVAGGVRGFTPGMTRIEGGFYLCIEADCRECSLVIYEEGKKKGVRFPFPVSQRIGNMWSMDVLGEDFSGLEYLLEMDGKEVPDPYGRVYTGRERWGERKEEKRAVRCRFEASLYDWEGDCPLERPLEETILYRIHPRGFTKHASSAVENRGTFQGICSKIPYLKELGITAVELMPSNEFDEVMREDGSDGNPYATGAPTGRINYWGYAPGQYFAPKASYTSGTKKDPVREFKDLVKELHRNEIEIILELYFTGEESASFVQEAVRFWVCEYHVDGVHLSGFAKTGLLAEDPVLARTKLFSGYWDTEKNGAGKPSGMRHLAEYNDGFLIDMRRVMKGDEGQMSNLVFRTRRNPAGCGVINYMANTNGFTMMDMVSYEQKHNEANGENNRDGSDENYTWNCGAEGPTRKKKVLAMRRRQWKNAWLLLLLSQGTPLLLSGDEFGNTGNGNNNAYCQDNEISWLNWKQRKTNEELFSFVKEMIAFRRRHSVFHSPTEPRNVDYLACGHPDVSYHGVNAWCPEFESFRRQLGIMYCGEYGRKEEQTPDDYFYVAYNMHWEPHEFALPRLPKGMKWHIAVRTDEEKGGVYPEGKELLLSEQKKTMIPPRTIMVLIGKAGDAAAQEEKKPEEEHV